MNETRSGAEHGPQTAVTINPIIRYKSSYIFERLSINKCLHIKEYSFFTSCLEEPEGREELAK